MTELNRKKKAKQKAVKAITRLIKAAKELAKAEAEYHSGKLNGGNNEQ